MRHPYTMLRKSEQERLNININIIIIIIIIIIMLLNTPKLHALIFEYVIFEQLIQNIQKTISLHAQIMMFLNILTLTKHLNFVYH